MSYVKLNGYSVFRKEEKYLILTSSGLMLVIVSAVIVLSMHFETDNLRDIIWTVLGLFLGVICAVGTNVYIRYSRQKQFLSKYDIVGTYNKISVTGETEMHDYGNRQVVIEPYDGLSFKMHSQYLHGNKIYIAVSTLTFNDDLSGLGYGSYKYEKLDNSGIYEVIAHESNGVITISIKFQNLYPNIQAIGTYLIKKQNGETDKSYLYTHVM